MLLVREYFEIKTLNQRLENATLAHTFVVTETNFHYLLQQITVAYS